MAKYVGQVSVSGPCDGFGKPDKNGSYFAVKVWRDPGDKQVMQETVYITREAVELLIAELNGVLVAQ